MRWDNGDWENLGPGMRKDTELNKTYPTISRSSGKTALGQFGNGRVKSLWATLGALRRMARDLRILLLRCRLAQQGTTKF